MVNVAQTFALMSARRLFVLGGLALIVIGMIFGDIFAVFVLHQNAGKQGAALVDAAQAVARQDPQAAGRAFQDLGSLLEDRGTKIDTHAHMIGAGYLALMLAIAQPYVVLAAATKKFLARLFISSGIALPIGIFAIHYIGLAYSPFAVIGWASVLADLSGFLLGLVVLIEIWGLVSYFLRATAAPVEPELPRDKTWSCRVLLTGGTVLILLGFLYGARYAAFDLYRNEGMEAEIVRGMLQAATANSGNGIAQHAQEFGNLAGDHAVQIAAHSHIIEFGLLAILLSFIQRYVFLSEASQRFWVLMLLAGSVILPIAVALELRFGLIAGGIADLGGLLVIIALIAMLAGVIRYTGSLDSTGATE